MKSKFLQNNFLEEAFQESLKTQKDKDFLKLLDIEEESSLSPFFEISGLQDAFRFRAQAMARSVASFLLNEKGDFKKENIKAVIRLIKNAPFILGYARENDALITHHILHVLRHLDKNPNLQRLFKKFRMPLCHKKAEELIRETLWLDHSVYIKNDHVKKAVLCAWLTPLRQNVGSCFATAPAILIQKDQPEHFLNDIAELLNTGGLKRTIGGIEYSAALVPNWGVGDIRKSLLFTPIERLHLSPGLIAALQTAGLINPDLLFLEKTEGAQKLLKNIFRKKMPMNVEHLLRELLLDHFDLTEDDISSEKRLEKIELNIQMQRPFQMLSGEKTTKAQKAVELEGKFQQACIAFKVMTENPLLKTWEFTIASFADVKLEFTRWNLFMSLGFDAKEEGGIGHFLYKFIEEKLRESNSNIEKLHEDYSRVYAQVRATEAMLYRAGNESQRNWLRVELQSQIHSMNTAMELRDITHRQAEQYDSLFTFLLEEYFAKLQEYFQELFDPNMQDVRPDLFNDSPAGFRLVYKHGRNDPTLWTFIQNEDQFIESLRDFFISTETQISSGCPLEAIRKELPYLTTQLVRFIQSKAFLESTIRRMDPSYRSLTSEDLVEKLPTLGKKPWAYISGGGVANLLRGYYLREKELTTIVKEVGNELDLLIFLIDFVKEKKQHNKMLMYSPTHAFIFRPDFMSFQEAVQAKGDTYKWVQDNLINPAHEWIDQMRLDSISQEILLEEFTNQFPSLEKHRLKQGVFIHRRDLTVSEFRSELLGVLEFAFNPEIEGHKWDWTSIVDSFLYSSLPCVSTDKIIESVGKILDGIPLKKDVVKQALNILLRKNLPLRGVTAKGLQDIALASLIWTHETPFFVEDYHKKISDSARKQGLIYPKPLLFADTNWPVFFFGFIVNPGTQELELWRLNRIGTHGFPMSTWKNWFPKSRWCIFSEAKEYN